MPSTDTRIVQMQFDNKDFEKNIATSQESLEKFKEELNFDEQEENLRNFGESTKNLKFDSMADNLQKLADKFTGLGTVSELVLSQLRRGLESAAASVSRFISSMTTEQISAGKAKFEQLNKSVQTIKAATGKSEEEVYKVMKRLNDYTDMTSYNFSDMATNIGKFTNVGIPLEKAEKQMEGITNWAARSGAGINEASRAMYNLSQAMGVGSLKMIDWRSIENAGMATKEFKEQLIEAGIAAGTLVRDSKTGAVKTAKSLGKQVEVNYSNLSSTLNKGWANKTVIGNTLEAYYYEDLKNNSSEAQEAILNLADGAKTAFGELSAEGEKAVDNLFKKNGEIDWSKWAELEKLGYITDETKKKLAEIAVANGTLTKEITEDGKEIYTTVTKNSLGETMSFDLETTDLEHIFDFAGSIGSTKWLNADVLKGTQAIFDSLFDNGKALDTAGWKKLENLGVITEDNKEQILELAEANGKLTSEMKDGVKVYTAVDKKGKKIEFTAKEIEKSLSTGWFDKTLGTQISTINTLAKEAYTAAQKCTSLTDVFNAWKDQLSTGWMNVYTNVFGQLSESMELFSTICNKVGEAIDTVMTEINAVLETWGNNGGRNELWGLLVGEYQDGETTMYEGAYGLLDVLTSVGNLLHDGFWNMIKLAIPTDLFEEAMGSGFMEQIQELYPDFEGGFDELWELDGAKESFLAYGIHSVIQNIQNFVQSIKDFFDAVPEGGTQSRFEMIQDVVNGIFATALLVYTIITKIGEFIGGIVKKFEPSADAIIKLLSKLGLGIAETAHEAATGDGLTNFFDGLLEAITPLTDAINFVITTIADLISKFVDGGNESDSFGNALQIIGDAFQKIFSIVMKIAGPVITFIGELIGVIADLFSGGLTAENLEKVGTQLETALVNLFNGIFGIFGDDIGTKIQSFFAYIFGFSEEQAEDGSEESANTIVSVLKQWLRKLFGSISSLFDGLKGENGQFSLFKMIESFIKDSFGIGLFGQFLGNIGKILQGANIYQMIALFGKLFLLFKLIQMISRAGGLFKSVKKFITGFSESTRDSVSLKLDTKVRSFADNLLIIAKGIGIIAAAVAGLGMLNLETLAKGIGSVTVIMGLMAGFMYVMKKITKDMELKQMAAIIGSIFAMGLSIATMSIGLAILILALKPLAKMNAGQMVTMLTGLLGIVTILGLFAKFVTSDLANIKTRDMLAIGILALGIGIMVRSLLPLSNINFGQLLNMMIGLAAILGELVLFAKLLGTKTFAGKGLWSLIGLAAGIGILILSLRSLVDLNAGQLIKMGVSLAVILTILAVFAKYMGTLKGTGMGQVILMAVGIGILLMALKQVANMEWGALLKMGVSLIALLTILAVFSKKMGSLKGTGMFSFILLATGIVILMEALKPLGQFAWGDLAKMGVSLIVVLGSLVLFTRMLGEMNVQKGLGVLVSLLGLAAVLGLFGVALNAAANVSWGQIISMCLGLAVVLVVFGIVVNMINNSEGAIMKGTHTLVAMIGLAAVMVAFSISLKQIKDIKSDQILAFSIGLSALILVISAALNITKGLSVSAAIKGIIIISVAIAAIMAVLSLMLPMLTGAIASSLQTMSAKLMLVADMFSTFMNRMSQFSSAEVDDAKEKFQKIYELLGIIKDCSGYTEAINAFALCLMDLGAGIGLFQYMVADIPDPDSSTAFKLIKKLIDMKDDISNFGIGGFSDAITSLGASMWLFNATTIGITAEEPAALKLISNILNLKDSLTGFTTGNFSSEISRIGSGLWLFNATTSGITTDEPLALSLLGKIVDFKSRIDDFLKVNVDEFSGKLSTLGGALTLYADGAKEVGGLKEGEVPDVENAVALLQQISESFSGEDGEFTIPEIPNTSEEFDTFGAKLVSLSTALIKFADASNGMDETKTKLAIDALKFLAKLKKRLTTDNLATVTAFTSAGVYPYTIETFSNDIVLLSSALTGFAEASNNFETDKTGNALAVLEFLKNLKTDLTTDNLATITAFQDAKVNPNTLAIFAGEIILLGTALGGFAKNTSGIGDLTNAKSALTFLSWLKTNLTTEAILTTLIFKGTGVDKDTLKQFALDITELGNALAEFANNVNFEEGKTKNFDHALEALDFLAKMQAKLPVLGGLEGWIKGNVETLGSFASDIAQLGPAMKEFSDALTGGGNTELEFNLELVQAAMSALSSLADMAKSFSAVVGNNIFDVGTYFVEMGTWMNKLSGLVAMNEVTNEGNFLDNFVQFITTLDAKMKEAGGIDSLSNIEAFKLTIESLKELSSIDQTLSFEPVGTQIATGLAQGMLGEEANTAVVTAAQEMIRRIKAAAEAEAIINSPSRLFADSIGKYLSLGIAKGINDNTDSPENAAENLVDDTMGGALGALARLSLLLTEGIDANPTITPVIDLSNVEAGVATINGWFGSGYGMTIDPSNARSYANTAVTTSAPDAGGNQNGSDLGWLKDTVTQLGAKMDDLGNRVAAMKMVLDTGTLVGEITDKVDASLGRKQFYRGRRN